MPNPTPFIDAPNTYALIEWHPDLVNYNIWSFADRDSLFDYALAQHRHFGYLELQPNEHPDVWWVRRHDPTSSFPDAQPFLVAVHWLPSPLAKPLLRVNFSAACFLSHFLSLIDMPHQRQDDHTIIVTLTDYLSLYRHSPSDALPQTVA